VGRRKGSTTTKATDRRARLYWTLFRKSKKPYSAEELANISGVSTRQIHYDMKPMMALYPWIRYEKKKYVMRITTRASIHGDIIKKWAKRPRTCKKMLNIADELLTKMEQRYSHKISRSI